MQYDCVSGGFRTCLSLLRFRASFPSVGKLAREGRFDHLLLESTGVSEPMPVAETFTFRDEEDRSLGDIAEIDTMVIVVDALNFLRAYESMEDLRDRGEGMGEEDERSIVDLLVDQIEFDALRVESLGGDPQSLLRHPEPVAAWLRLALFEDLLEVLGLFPMVDTRWRDCRRILEERVSGS